jgi:hypothetical protein
MGSHYWVSEGCVVLRVLDTLYVAGSDSEMHFVVSDTRYVSIFCVPICLFRK